MKKGMAKEQREVRFGTAVCVFLAAVSVLIWCVAVKKLDPHIPLLFASAVIMLYGVWLRISWSSMREEIIGSISESLEAILIICLIGVVIGSWMAGGTVPAIIYYGLNIFSPRWFLVSVILLCGLMSITTGSSWTTIGTIGVAFLGIGYGLKIPAGVTAGAIVCGAYFGDKQSPMSDSTNFAAAVAKTDLYRHIKSMIYTTGPAFLLSTLLFLLLGMKYGGGNANAAQVEMITKGIADSFYISPVLLLPLGILLFLIIRKFPAIPTMLIAALLGLLQTVFMQKEAFAKAVTYMYSGFVGNTGVEAVDRLLTRGGLLSMTGTIVLMLMSLMLAGLLQATGIMRVIMQKLNGITRRRFGLISTTLGSTFLLSFFASDPYLAMLLPANALGGKYDEQGIDRSVLSRTLEDGGTVMCPIVPWGTNGIYCAATLGVAVGTYLPFYFMGILTPVFSLICAASGFGIIKAVSGRKGE